MTDTVERLRDEIERLRRDLEIWRRNGGDILLKAEIGRLQETITDRELEIKTHLREIERLRAEIYRLRAENEELRRFHEHCGEEDNLLHAEIERLRTLISDCPVCSERLDKK